MLPPVFNDMRTYSSDIHDYNTRFSKKLRPPKHNLTLKTRTMRVFGIQLYNYMQRFLFFDCPIGTFKTNLKAFLLSHDIPRTLT